MQSQALIRMLRQQFMRPSGESDAEIEEIQDSNPVDLIEEESFLEQVRQYTPHLDIPTLRDVISRLGEPSRTLQDTILSHISSRYHTLREEEPQRVRYYREDEIAESFDELLIPDLVEEDYIDFRQYPYQVDWKEVENDKSYAYECLVKFGYMGCAIYTGVINLGLKIKYYKIPSEVLSMYLKLYKQGSRTRIRDFMEVLPSLRNIGIILEKSLYTRREVLLIKIVLDIHEHHLRTGSVDIDHYKVMFLTVGNFRFLHHHSDAILQFDFE